MARLRNTSSHYRVNTAWYCKPLYALHCCPPSYITLQYVNITLCTVLLTNQTLLRIKQQWAKKQENRDNALSSTGAGAQLRARNPKHKRLQQIFETSDLMYRKQGDGGGGSDPRRCTNSSHRCHHAAHAYTGLSCRQLRLEKIRHSKSYLFCQGWKDFIAN